MKPACGPPKPIGTPKRWVVPTAMSAPSAPGEVSSVRASRSAATVTIAPSPWACSMTGSMARTAPEAPGYWSSTPKTPRSAISAGMPSLRSATTTSTPVGSARVSITATVCGRVSASTRKTPFLTLPTRRDRAIASAAAVPSSSSEAPEVGSPVSSATIVWKFRRASRRPWEISGWYGV